MESSLSFSIIQYIIVEKAMEKLLEEQLAARLKIVEDQLIEALQNVETALQESEAARQKSQALQESHAARPESEAVRQEAQAARQESQAARQKSEAARQESQAALQKSEAARQETQAALQKFEVRMENVVIKKIFEEGLPGCVMALTSASTSCATNEHQAVTFCLSEFVTVDNVEKFSNCDSFLVSCAAQSLVQYNSNSLLSPNL